MLAHVKATPKQTEPCKFTRGKRQCTKKDSLHWTLKLTMGAQWAFAMTMSARYMRVQWAINGRSMGAQWATNGDALDGQWVQWDSRNGHGHGHAMPLARATAMEVGRSMGRSYDVLACF